MDRFRGLVDVGKLGLDYVRIQAGTVRLGAGTTYAGAVRGLAAFDTCHPLVQALGSAATTPLRNRITVGGSVASFPYWSDLMGPLLALEAEVELTGGGRGGRMRRGATSGYGSARGGAGRHPRGPAAHRQRELPHPEVPGLQI